MLVKVLITGSHGFVGRHFVREYQLAGHDVVDIDLKDGVDAIDYFRLSDERFDLLIHCAAIVGGRTTIDGDPLAVATNLALDSWAFRWAVNHVDRMVYFSSSAVYPVDLQVEYAPGAFTRPGLQETEADPRFTQEPDYGNPNPKPDATYGLAKLVGENLAWEAAAEGLKVFIFRPFSGYGWDQDLSYPFPMFVKRAAEHEDPFEVWGTGRQTRDFIHIDDIVRAVQACLEQDFRGPVNLCTGRVTTFLELAQMCSRAAGYEPEVVALIDKPTGVHHRVGDPTLLKKVYTPVIELESGIDQAMPQRLRGRDRR